MEWHEITRKVKPFPIILIDSVCIAFRDYFTEFHDKKTRIENYRQAFGGRGISEKDWQNYVKMYKDNPDKITVWMQSWLDHFTELKDFCEKANKMNPEKKSNAELKSLMQKFFDLQAKAVVFAYEYHPIGQIYPEKIMSFLKKRTNNAKELNNLMEIILSIPKPIEMNKEKESILKIAVKAKKGLSKQKLRKEMETHAEKFGFLGMYIFRGDPYSVEHYEKELKKLLRKPLPSLEKDFLKEKNRFKENQNKLDAIIKKLRLSEEEVALINSVRFALWVSLVCDEYYTMYSLFIRPVLVEISKRFSLSYNQLTEMQIHEVLELFDKPLTQKKLNEINARIEDHVLLLEKGKIRLLTGKELEEYSRPYMQKLNEMQKLELITGETAFPGKAKGKVKLIKSIHDLPSFPSGAILVTGSTMPQFVPAMKKSLAIITDEGGMLSHAAIMSREFKKPCVIGTKIATRVLKDNEVIEVDAGKGIIKRLK
ncbi:hypothetical protein KKG83_04000 [Candidatus Micrarchaeota archaeon]|nr:hypothetical protein [Candidatus Micrarchaeota archaeon]